MIEETITITVEEHDRLRSQDLLVQALQAGGVDNWTWWDDAIERWLELKEKNGLKD